MMYREVTFWLDLDRSRTKYFWLILVAVRSTLIMKENMSLFQLTALPKSQMSDSAALAVILAKVNIPSFRERQER